MEVMEASFKSRVEQAFGALLGSSSQGISPSRLASVASSSPAGTANVSANSWSVSEVAIPCNRGLGLAEESSGSESDEPCAARYEKFVQLAKHARKRRAGEDDEGMNEENDWDEGRVTKRKRRADSEDQVAAESRQQDVDEDDECREMRLMVGMDDTLDFEEEEDEYDKVAVGREGAGERVYMREIKGAGCAMSPLTPLPVPVPGVEGRQLRRDSRANHAAAAARLKEDDRLASVKNSEVARILMLAGTSTSVNKQVVDSKRVSSSNNGDINVSSDPGVSSSPMSNIKSALKSVRDGAGNGNSEAESSKSSKVVNEERISSNTENHSAMQVDSRKEAGENSRDGINLPKQDGSGVKKEARLKKVRFALDDHVIEEKEPAFGGAVEKVFGVPVTRNRYSRVPDYVRNPSKYTHYTLDWSDEEVDNKANITAFQATWEMTHARDEEEVTGMVELPKSITFTPRNGGASSKRHGEAKHSTGSGFQQSQALVSFAEEAVVDNSPRLEEDSHSKISIEALVEAKTTRVFRKRARDEEKNDSNDDSAS